MAEMMEIYQETENNVLAALIVESEILAHEVFSRVKPDDFVTGISRTIFETCRDMYSRGDVIDPLTVKAACDGEYSTWIDEYKDIVPAPHHCSAYVDQLIELSKRYRLQQLFREALSVSEYGLPMEELIGKVECMNAVLASDADQRSLGIRDMLVRFYGRMGQKRTFIDWGFDELNRYVKINPKDYVIIGARPSTGKTAFALQAALHMAQRYNVTFFSLETDNESVTDRIMSRQSGVELSHIQSGELSEAEIRVLVEQKASLIDRNFHFYESTGITVEEIRAVTNKNHSEIIIIDYLQLVKTSGRQKQEYEEVTEVTKALQRLAKSGVCVIALSQLSRTGEGMGALRGSGQIEQDADVVMLLDYPNLKDMESDEERADYEAGRLRLIDIVKNRNGRRGTIPFWFCGAQQRFLVQWEGFYHAQLRQVEEQIDKLQTYDRSATHEQQTFESA